MKSTQQQYDSLDLIAKAAMKHVVNCVARMRQGDVATLSALGVEGAHEIVSPIDDTYDVWKDGGPIEFNVSLDRAVTLVITDYKEHKIDLVMTSALGKNWKFKDHKRWLQEVTARVYDDEAQRKASLEALRSMKK